MIMVVKKYMHTVFIVTKTGTFIKKDCNPHVSSYADIRKLLTPIKEACNHMSVHMLVISIRKK